MQADAARNQVIQGTGLGLSITKAYVEMLGGRIHLESIPGKGSEFYFTMPYSILPKTSGFEIEKESRSTDDNYFKDLRILIAEDDLASILLLEALFPKTEYPVLKARTGLEVVEMCKNNPDLDFILMDIRMPELNGYEATKRIRAFNKTVKIIAQTAHGLSGDKEKALEAGCNDYISKPVNINQLLLIMKNQLDIQKH
jgi:CheY-like chemotaxis protein